MADEKTNLEDEVMCLNQCFRPEGKNYSHRADCGDCLTCTSDENNKYCKRNIKIKVRHFYVKEKT